MASVPMRIVMSFTFSMLALFASAQADGFSAVPIGDSIMHRIVGKSYKPGCGIPLGDLRYVSVLHCDAQGNTRRGELICHKSIAGDLVDIFKTLYENGYRIERMVLVDEYDADDERSMAANNTSCFNYRRVAGTKTLSKHSRGLAIDINPLVNPCVNLCTGKIEPQAGKPYAYHRENGGSGNGGKADGKGRPAAASLPMIDRNDLCYRLFIQHGFKWGGEWTTKKDYQHFEK